MYVNSVGYIVDISCLFLLIYFLPTHCLTFLTHPPFFLLVFFSSYISLYICLPVSLHIHFCPCFTLLLTSPHHSSGDYLLLPPRQKRIRTSFKHDQLRVLKSYFCLNQNPDSKDLKELSHKTRLSKRVLQVYGEKERTGYRSTPIPHWFIERSLSGVSLSL